MRYSISRLSPFLEGLFIDSFEYYSDKSLDELKSDIQQVIDDSQKWFPQHNLTGKFSSDYIFKMTPNSQFARYKGIERMESYLNGQIFQDESGRTRVNFSIRPNSTLWVLFIVFPIAGIAIMSTENVKGDPKEIFFGGLIFSIAVPCIILGTGYFAKRRMKRRFIAAFDLKVVDEIQSNRSR